jgi:hypothetical protein
MDFGITSIHRQEKTSMAIAGSLQATTSFMSITVRKKCGGIQNEIPHTKIIQR